MLNPWTRSQMHQTHLERHSNVSARETRFLEREFSILIKLEKLNDLRERVPG